MINYYESMAQTFWPFLQTELATNRDSSPSAGLRTAFSTANKALSWRGDHPMKNEHFFQANNEGHARPFPARIAQKQNNRNSGKSKGKSCGLTDALARDCTQIITS